MDQATVQSDKWWDKFFKLKTSFIQKVSQEKDRVQVEQKCRFWHILKFADVVKKFSENLIKNFPKTFHEFVRTMFAKMFTKIFPEFCPRIFQNFSAIILSKNLRPNLPEHFRTWEISRYGLESKLFGELM